MEQTSVLTRLLAENQEKHAQLYREAIALLRRIARYESASLVLPPYVSSLRAILAQHDNKVR